MTRRRRAAALAAVAAVVITSLGVARATGDAPQGCERSRLDAAERRAFRELLERLYAGPRPT